MQNDSIERLGVERAVIYRRCKFEDIDIPLVHGSLDSVPMEGEDGNGPAQMDLDLDDDGTQRPLQAKDYGIEVDFSELEDEEKENGSEDFGEELEAAIAKIDAEIVRMAPNMKAADKYVPETQFDSRELADADISTLLSFCTPGWAASRLS